MGGEQVKQVILVIGVLIAFSLAMKLGLLK